MAKKIDIPTTDSIHELAEFWDSHDVTDFQDELEEVSENIFEKESNQTSILFALDANDLPVLKKNAKKMGMNEVELVNFWIHQKIHEYG